MVPDSVAGYMDSSIALPLITAYLMNRCRPRKPRRLYDRREDLYEDLKEQYDKTKSGALAE